MFQIVKDAETAAGYAEAGLLYWVGKADGGHSNGIITIALTSHTDEQVHQYVRANSHHGIFGVQVEE